MPEEVRPLVIASLEGQAGGRSEGSESRSLGPTNSIERLQTEAQLQPHANFDASLAGAQARSFARSPLFRHPRRKTPHRRTSYL